MSFNQYLAPSHKWGLIMAVKRFRESTTGAVSQNVNADQTLLAYRLFSHKRNLMKSDSLTLTIWTPGASSRVLPAASPFHTRGI